MTWRKGHGTGKGQPRIEVMPPDELPTVTPSDPVRSDRGADGRFSRGNTVGRLRRVKPGPRGLAGIDRASPDFAPFARWGARYASHRRGELAHAHGGEISAGVGAIVESGALAMAASRYLHWLASQSGDIELFKQSANLAATARQHELASWELAARESKLRPAMTSEQWDRLLDEAAKPRGT